MINNHDLQIDKLKAERDQLLYSERLHNEALGTAVQEAELLRAERDQVREERDRLKAALSKSQQTAERWREECMYFWSMS